MSGICGICQPGREIARTNLEPMLLALALPDERDRDGVAGRSAAVGASRRWPFQQAAEVAGVRIAVDADLCNQDEVDKLLAAKGLVAFPMSLAERLAWLYLLHGPAFVEQLRGAFSIAIWDDKAQRLLLAIDGFGIKSLYWSQEGDRLVFASRAAGVRAAQERPAEINRDAVMQFLLFSVVPAPLTIYQGMEKLRPGFWLFFDKGQVRQQRYWDLDYSESENLDERYWAEQVREGLRSAVHRGMDGCASETTGAYLSGGTDSSSVVAFMSERFWPVNTFSISFPETRYNEIGYARITAARFRTIHRERCLSPEDAREAIPRITQYYDEPFANSSAIAAYYCARLARESGIDTLLAGDGGDELFAGNEHYARNHYFALYHSLPSWVRQGVIEPVARLLPREVGWLSLPRRYIKRARIPNPRRVLSYGFYHSVEPTEVFDAGFLSDVPPSRWLGIAEAHFHTAPARNELNRLLYLDVKMILADNDLRKVTGTAELAGVRARFPLLDQGLAELSARIPHALKMKGFEKRYIFKRAMEGILPRKVIHKKKHGFGVPLSHWFLQDAQLNALAQDVLRDPRTRQRGYFRTEFLDELITRHRQDHTVFYGQGLWYALALELWHRQHLEVSRGGAVAH